MRSNLLFILCASAFMFSCTTMTSTVNVPQFQDEAAVKTEISKLIAADSVVFEGKDMSIGDSLSAELSINIFNGKSVPEIDEFKNALAKKIATSAKKNLQSNEQYSVYKVVFTSIKGNSMVSAEIGTSDVFKNEELQ